MVIIFAVCMGLGVLLWGALCWGGFSCTSLSDWQAKLLDIAIVVFVVLFFGGLIGFVVALCLA